MSVINNNVLAGAAGSGGAAGYTIDNSLRFNSGDSAFLNKTLSASGNTKTWTFSCWVKRSSLGASYDGIFATTNSSGVDGVYIDFTSDHFQVGEYGSSSWTWMVQTAAKYRDVSAWYHIVVAVDTTQSTASDRVKIWINGERITEFYPGLETYPNQGYPTKLNDARYHAIGRLGAYTGGYYFPGYMAEMYFIDGQALTATDFGEFDEDTGVWNPIEYTGDWTVADFTGDTTVYMNGAVDNTTAGRMWDGDNLSSAYASTGVSTDYIEWAPTGGYTTPGYIWVQGGDGNGNGLDHASKTVQINGSTVSHTAVVDNDAGGTVYGVHDYGNWYKFPVSGNTLTSLKVIGVYPLVRQVSTVADPSFAALGISDDADVPTLQTSNVNSFYLDFSDNSSASALGTDASGIGNNWTVNSFESGAVRTTAGVAWTSSINVQPIWSNYNEDTIDTTTINGSTFESTSVINPNGNTSIGYWWSNDLVTWFRTNSNSASGSVSTALYGRYLRIAISGGSDTNTAYINCESYTGPSSEIDSLKDSPTNGNPTLDTGLGGELPGNYCVINPLLNPTGQGTLSNGNLQVDTGTSTYGLFGSTIATPAGVGKWYMEFTCTALASPSYLSLGIFPTTTVISGNTPSIYTAGVSYYRGGTLQKYNTTDASATTGSYTTGDVIGVALDADNSQVTFYKNGVSAGTVTSIGSHSFYFGGNDENASGSDQIVANFGQRAFAYTAPAGYKCLCTANLPDPDIADGSTAMNATVFAGTGLAQTINTPNHTPDLVWVKSRTNAYSNLLFDRVRGDNQVLKSDQTDAEADFSPNYVGFRNDNAFDILGSATWINANATSSVAWTWDAGTGSPVSNTDGSITSSVRANASAGFSIVSYTGTGANATLGHGLNAAPEFAIFKVTSTTNNWAVYHKGIGATDQIKLNQTAASSASASFFQNTAPTSSVIYLGADSTANYSSQDMIAYCWAPVEGYSAFGSYTGNGLVDGAFVYTGFRPRWILLKSATDAREWTIWDTARDTYNSAGQYIYPHGPTPVAEQGSAGGNRLDILSNGFKVRSGAGFVNDVNDTFIYAAFAEHPFKTARAH